MYHINRPSTMYRKTTNSLTSHMFTNHNTDADSFARTPDHLRKMTNVMYGTRIKHVITVIHALDVEGMHRCFRHSFWGAEHRLTCCVEKEIFSKPLINKLKNILVFSNFNLSANFCCVSCRRHDCIVASTSPHRLAARSHWLSY